MSKQSAIPLPQGVHVKNRCAWLNHSEEPQVFVDLVRRYPNIRLWFSGTALTNYSMFPAKPFLSMPGWLAVPQSIYLGWEEAF